MNRLDSGGVVIERDDLAPGVRNRCLDALFQIEILDRWRQRLSQRLSDLSFAHVAISFAVKSRIRGEASFAVVRCGIPCSSRDAVVASLHEIKPGASGDLTQQC